MLAFKLINFVILVSAIVWAIRKFDLFKFLENRRKKVANNINEAQKIKTQAQELKATRERELEEAQVKQKEIINEAKRIGQKAKQKLIAEAEEETKRILEEAQIIAEMEKIRLEKQMRKETIKEIIATASGILKKEVSEKDHYRLINSFLDELEEDRSQVGVS